MRWVDADRWWAMRSVAVLATAVLLTTCTGDVTIEDGGERLVVDSSELSEGEPIPVEFTCDGDDVPPQLSWSSPPDDAAEVVIVVDDPDAPSGTFTHWTVWGLDPAASSIEPDLPSDAIEGANDFGDTGYRGPCPPEGGDLHHYRFRILTVDTPVDLPEAAAPDELAAAVDGHVTASGTLTATYGR